MTARQEEALAWLRIVGKATERSAKRAGFSRRTLESLVTAGAVRVEYRSAANAPFPVYYPVATS